MNAPAASLRLLLWSCAVLASTPAGQAGVTVINFDGVPDNTAINSYYSGLTFTNPIGGNIYARNGGGFAPSSPNVVSVLSSNSSIFAFFDAGYGAVDVILSTPVRSVSIDARPVGPVEYLGPLTSRPYLQVLSAAGGYLGPTIYYAGALPTGCCWEVGPAETLTVVSAQNTNDIWRVRFSSQQTGAYKTYGLFDNLRLDTGFYTLAAPVSGGGTVGVTPLKANYYHGDVATLKASANPGWKFSGWSGDATGTNNPVAVTMTADRTITANFTPLIPSIILDNRDAEFIGSWSNVTATTAYGGACRGRVADGDDSQVANYQPTISVAGNYDVSVWYPDTVGFGTSYADHAINHKDGLNVVRISQGTGGGSWRLLAAEQPFSAGADGYVQIYNGRSQAGKYLAADAVRFSWSAVQAMPALQASCVPSGSCLTLAWASIPERVYRVQYKTQLSSPSWTDLPGDVVAAGWTASKPDCPPVGPGGRFYRVVLLPN